LAKTGLHRPSGPRWSEESAEWSEKNKGKETALVELHETTGTLCRLKKTGWLNHEKRRGRDKKEGSTDVGLGGLIPFAGVKAKKKRTEGKKLGREH